MSVDDLHILLIEDSQTDRILIEGLLHETLGGDWLTPDLFRFGASSLANDVLMQLVKQQTGIYTSSDYFSND